MIKSKENLSIPAYQHILDLIFTKRLLPGDKLCEAKIASELGISRTPIREAIKQLVNDGLVKISATRHTEIYGYSKEEIHQIGTLRLSLDLMAVKLALFNGSRADFMSLLQVAKLHETETCEKFDHENARYDGEFHLALAEISGNDVLVKFQRELFLKVQFIALHNEDLSSHYPAHNLEHIQIAGALLNSDEKLCRELLTEHLVRFYNLTSKYPADFFDIN